MTPEASPFDSAIAELECQVVKLQTALETLKQLRSGGTYTATAASITSGARPGDADVQHDSFFGMTIGDAARKYLSMVKTTKSTAEIAEALERGGLKHSSKDFNTTLRSILGPREEFVRVNKDWGLTEWYPGMRKDKKAKSKAMEPETPIVAAPLSKKGPKGREPSAPIQTPNEEGLDPKAHSQIAVLKAFRPNTPLSLKDISEATGLPYRSSSKAVFKLVNAGKLRKLDVGKYEMISDASSQSAA